MTAGLRGRWGAFPWIVVLAVVLLAAATRSPTLILLGVIGLAAWGLVELTGRLALVAVEASASLAPRRLVAGERTTLTVRVANRKPLPVPWLEVRVDLPEGVVPPRADRPVDPGHVSASFAVRARERVTVSFPLELPQRGAYVVGPLHLRAGDWLGFVQGDRDVALQLEVVAHPASVAVADHQLASLRPVTEAPTRRGLIPDPLRFRGVREYRGGDPVKEIHWKASARLLALHTKVYEPATSLDAVFLLNVASYEQYWVQADPEAADLSVSVAAELIRLSAKAGRQVGLITNGIDNLTHQRPRSALSRGPRAVTRCLDILARLGPYAGAAPETIFLHERGRMAGGATLVCVTPTVMPRLAAALVVLRRSGHRVLVVALDRPEPGVTAHLGAVDVPLVVLDAARASPWARPGAVLEGVRAS